MLIPARIAFIPDNQSDKTTSQPEISTSGLKLQKIDFEPFDGNKDYWDDFKRLFEAYIHNNKHLTDIEKHQWLTTKLKGEPSTMVAKLPRWNSLR